MGLCRHLLACGVQMQPPVLQRPLLGTKGEGRQQGRCASGECAASLQLGREEQRLAAPSAYKGRERAKDTRLCEQGGSAGVCGWRGFGVKRCEIGAEVVVMETAVIPCWMWKGGGGPWAACSACPVPTGVTAEGTALQ